MDTEYDLVVIKMWYVRIPKKMPFKHCTEKHVVTKKDIFTWDQWLKHFVRSGIYNTTNKIVEYSFKGDFKKEAYMYCSNYEWNKYTTALVKMII